MMMMCLLSIDDAFFRSAKNRNKKLFKIKYFKVLLMIKVCKKIRQPAGVNEQRKKERKKVYGTHLLLVVDGERDGKKK